ncbi:TadE/TadG family type IV pilus assembly protein [Georgenia sp. SYP-B2076]|uniref:TadE/TadG family type IV pilus assembly protein n=1 Tax=Georgenia sp. SYP-B2076 TaxID=2495881 RepID=UPI000F8C51BB|nr:TadE/TadG family type IV pilus assembly protein [Georgenia sp. SYP-B2076]
MGERSRGSALVDFVLVSALVVVIVVGLIQVTLALHVRNTLIDSASEGARRAALVGSSTEAGVARTRELIGLTLSPRYAEDVSARTIPDGAGGTVEIRVSAPLPVLGLLGPGGVVTVHGHAVLEQEPGGAAP